MSTDGLEPAARAIRESALARMVLGIDAAIRAAAPRSRVGQAAARFGRSVDLTSPSERIQLGGVVVLTAAVVHELLRPLTSVAVRAAAPHAVVLPIVVVAAAAIAAAPAIARSWPQSRLRRWLSGR